MSSAPYPLAFAHETPLGRATVAFAETLEETGIDDRWMAATVRGLCLHLSAELVVAEQHAGRPLTLQDAAAFLAAIGEDNA